MCGILGVIGGNISIGTFINCLEDLSTRGQEAAGLTGFANGFISEKCQGTAINLEKKIPYSSETINACVGSTRYPTIGALNQESMHFHLSPFIESTRRGMLSLVFNGNIIYPHVNKEENDGALLTRLLKRNLEDGPTIYSAVRRLLSEIDGAYSAIALIGDDKLIAFRDPNGVRPLCWGKLDDGYFVTSETRILEKLGIKEYNFVSPGSLMIFSKESIENHRFIYQKSHPCMFEWTYFSQAPSNLDGKEVYQVRFKLGQKLGKLLFEQDITDIDYVIPVPNTAKTAALGCASFLGLQYADGLIKSSSGRIFIKPNEKDRFNAVNKVYETVPSIIRGKDLILIDDSIVRGTTLKRVIELLHEKGAQKIHVGITTPMIKFPCVYGIDMSRPGELLAATNSVDIIKKILGCDSLIYMTIKDLHDAIGVQSLCTACLDGNYPTEKAKVLLKDIRSMNEDVRCYEQVLISR
ncbi:MAG: amidophosphoribosyltransferase [Candidatus Hodarchaeales archaeon]|jgi:amidophosphoribosyltransferase